MIENAGENSLPENALKHLVNRFTMNYSIAIHTNSGTSSKVGEIQPREAGA